MKMRTRDFLAMRFLVVFAVLLKGASRVDAAATTAVEVSRRVIVARAGEPVQVQCRAGKALQYCRIEHTSPTTSGRLPNSWNLKEGFGETSEGVAYDGAGLDEGQCGMRIRRLPESFNGGYRCTLGFKDNPVEGIGHFNITVAVPPQTPELQISKQGSGSSRPGSNYPSGNYPGGSNWGGNRFPEEFMEGDTLVASCVVRDARPQANITWYLDDQELRYQDRPVVTHSDTRDLYTIEQNITMQLSWKDHGKSLRCVSGHIANDKNNETKSEISVRFAPRPHSTSMEQFGFVVGLPGEIPVEVNAYPKPNIMWKINDQELQENGELEGHFKAAALMNNGSGSWTAVLRINDVTHQDIDREYTLQARNDLGLETYRIRLSTSSEPSVMSLEAGAIIGIVAAILVLLLAIFLIVFARTTGRWCFAGGESKQDPKESVKFLPEEGDASAKDKTQNDENAPLAATTNMNESSDTESADHGPTHAAKKSKSKLSNIFKKKGDKVGDDSSVTKEVDSPILQRPVQQQQQQPQQGQTLPNAPDSVVYAELDLKDLGERRPQVRPDEERTEYAEILYTAKPDGGPEHTSPPQP